MCAIFGFVGFEETGLADRMARALQHRGPDGEGFLQDPARRFHMGMRRLAIIDLDGGHQPIFNESGDLALCFNGEIYNYRELAAELRELGHAFGSDSDGECIVHGFEQWGEGVLNRLNGMFALALYDRRTGALLLARDRSGQKPLYYHSHNGRFLFASEVKALLESAHVPRECDPQAIDPYLTLRYVPEPRTMFRDVFTLPAAHLMRRRSDGSITIERYHDIVIDQVPEKRPDREWLELVEHQLRESIRLTMRSDVPVGAYLSAGIDSSLIAALMREQRDRVDTYSIGFGTPFDETRAAAETSALLGTRHHEIECRPEHFERLPEVVRQMDRPVGDALIVAFDRLAAETSRDVKVVLSGEGADEIFGGYSFHKLLLMQRRYHQLCPEFLHRGVAMPLLGATPDHWLDKFFAFPAKLGSQGKARLIDSFGGYRQRDLAGNCAALRTLWGAEDRQALYTDAQRSHVSADWQPRERDRDGSFVDRMLRLQWDDWLPDWCAIRQDKNSMAHSLEVRFPFLDHRLMDLAFRLPARLKVTMFKDKIIERRLGEKVLPREIARRGKKPFYLPMEFLFDHPQIAGWIDRTLNENQVRKRGLFDPAAVKRLLQRMETREFIGIKQVMSLVILELWHQVFIDREMP